MSYDGDFKEAVNGEEAVKFIKSNHCDVMVLDLKMPKKSGIVVIKEAKEIDPNIDIFVMSAYESNEVAEEAMKLGATDYAVKPLDLKAVSMKLDNILKKRGQLINIPPMPTLS
jgi:YesN/AraC family two-component response regulator